MLCLERFPYVICDLASIVIVVLVILVTDSLSLWTCMEPIKLSGIISLSLGLTLLFDDRLCYNLADTGRRYKTARNCCSSF